MGIVDAFTRPTEEIYGYPLMIGEYELADAVGDPRKVTIGCEENVYHKRFFIKTYPEDPSLQETIYQMRKAQSFLWGEWLGCKEPTPTDYRLAIRGGLYIILNGQEPTQDD